MKCPKCNAELKTIYEIQNDLCDTCFSEQYAKDAILDNLTKEPTDEINTFE